ncbi:unnamed protein product [Paramecium pentaurelia]|uniref:Uncharacterized protein n=1 Tax=Paramecium pentaurelia TaxID=43138 RepID=A0A8S1WJ15_9CILI|nr:unnamed protein product [Paramecium pentaurelia]
MVLKYMCFYYQSQQFDFTQLFIKYRFMFQMVWTTEQSKLRILWSLQINIISNKGLMYLF